jgi:hypothetical protein
MKKLLLFVSFALLLSNINYAQNDFPTPTNSIVTLDGGYIKMIKPVTTGGWARGFLYYKTINESAWAGIGLLGQDEAVSKIYLAHGSAPWSSNNGIYILPSGYTGIGIDAPSSMLDVKGVVSINQRSDNGNPRLVFAHNNIEADNWIQMDRNTDFMNIRVGGVDAINIDGENHLVGIGTTSPNATLQVGDSENSGSPSSEVEVKRLSLAPVTHSGSDWFFTTRDNNPYANLDIGYHTNKNLSLRHDGNVGIGTSNPSELLTVKGKILAGEVQIENVHNIPDYVFEDDYNLRSIAEVDSYIKENKHLPDVPSASELEENGYNIGDMNNILLKKVEELTLYMIDMKKSLDEKDAQIEELQQKISQIEKNK